VVVRITDDEGSRGIGEADTFPGRLQAFIDQPTFRVWSQSFRGRLVGRDPVTPRFSWRHW
jgi:L-alanine-DL-glutamate epimerase-like enolase superfamily enzyme